jgi:hypothetical protein
MARRLVSECVLPIIDGFCRSAQRDAVRMTNGSPVRLVYGAMQDTPRGLHAPSLLPPQKALSKQSQEGQDGHRSGNCEHSVVQGLPGMPGQRFLLVCASCTLQIENLFKVSKATLRRTSSDSISVSSANAEMVFVR